MIIAETPRLFLRHLTLDDLDFMAGLLDDPDVMRFSLGRMTREQVKTLIETCLAAYEKNEPSLWGIEDKTDHRLIGYCGHYRRDLEGKEEVEVAYRLAPEHWGRGFAAEAVKAACDYAFAKLGLERLIAFVEPANTPSIRVAEKCGMTLEKQIIKWDRPFLVYAIHPFKKPGNI